MTNEEFIEKLKEIGIELTEKQIEQLEIFYNFMIEKNKVMNLTTIIEKKDVYLKHFYDSLTLVKVEDFNKNLKICDVGSGAGFPGVVLKIVFPNVDIVLIDALNKRVVYLNELIQLLNLTGIVAIHERMEDYSKKNEEKFDLITVRAVSGISIICEISVKALKLGGKLLLMKGESREEIETSKKALHKLKMSIINIEKFNLPYEESNRSIITIAKTQKTPVQYPRDINKIKKNPL